MVYRLRMPTAPKSDLERWREHAPARHRTRIASQTTRVEALRVAAHALAEEHGKKLAADTLKAVLREVQALRVVKPVGRPKGRALTRVQAIRNAIFTMDMDAAAGALPDVPRPARNEDVARFLKDSFPRLFPATLASVATDVQRERRSLSREIAAGTAPAVFQSAFGLHLQVTRARRAKRDRNPR